MSPAAQLHPLAAHPDQRLLQARQRAELGEIQSIVAECDLPLDVAQAVQPDGRGRRPGGGPRLGLEAKVQPGPGRAPPGRRQDPEAGLFEDRGSFAEEPEHAGGIGHLFRGRRGGQRGAERGDEPGREPEAAQKQLVGVRHMTLQGRQLGTVGPHRRGPDEQAGVVDCLERELDPPVVIDTLFIDTLFVAGPVVPVLAVVVAVAPVLVAGNRGLDAEAGAHRLGGRVRRGMPGPQYLGERLTVGGGYAEVVGAASAGSAVRRGQGGQPSLDGIGPRGMASATGWWLGRWPIGQEAARQRVGHAPHIGAHDVGRRRRVRPRARPMALVGHAGTRERPWKVPAEGLDAPAVVAVHQWTPSGPPTGGRKLQIGQDATPGDQLEGQVGGLRGEAEVRGEGDIRLPRDHCAPRVCSAEGDGQTRRVAGIEGKSRRRPLRQGLARPRRR